MASPVLDSGSPEPLGVTPAGDGVNVAVFSAHATAIEFCLFDAAGGRELRRVKLPERSGDIFHGLIGDVPAGSRYGLRAHGIFAPAEGHRFNPAKLLIDPYARAIDRPFKLHASMFGGEPDSHVPDGQDSNPAMPKAIVAPAPVHLAPHMLTPWNKTVLYELHVRGFTMRRESIPAELRGTFGGLAHPASIEHLVKLGVTSVEIMPAAAWMQERHLAALGMDNYWGYNTIAFMTPDPRLAPGGWDEVRATVQTLAEAGIETIADIVLNHSGEGDAGGPTLSFRGLDNASYYRLMPNAPGDYADDAGCGNVLALDRPPVLRLAMDALRAWAEWGGVHGFRFDLATVLGRRDDGFDYAAPLLSAIDQDPVLRNLKLIAEPWDIGHGGYRVGDFPAHWGEWNDRYRDELRRFWRGDDMGLGQIATRLAGSADLFGRKRRPSRSINFIVAHDGFTLKDLVSYERKDNDANGEQNRDGSDVNHSWNNGVEGSSDNPSVRAARSADQRALLAILLLARGTPMLAMGSELGHSQRGNNNAYAQDNDISWIDWDTADGALFAWTARLTGIRRDHPAFREDRFLTGQLAEPGFLPDVAWFGPQGRAMDIDGWNAPDGPALVMVLSCRTPTGFDRAAVAINRGHARVDIVLPEAREGYGWSILADSANPIGPDVEIDGKAHLPGRSVMALGEIAHGPATTQMRPGRATALDRLSRAAGIAAEWQAVDGSRHVVGDDTRRALLASLQLPASSESEATDTLGRFAEEHDRRPLPYTLAAWEAEAPVLEVPLDRGLSRLPMQLLVALETGEVKRVSVAADDGELRPAIAADGREHQLWRVPLPAMGAGRHTILREDAAQSPCRLTVAPRRGFLPAALADGGRSFGIAAQLYSLRGPADQGVGDFSLLADLATATAREEGSAVIINPLHALFAADRSRTSPYQPSDRRFLDPIYINVGAMGDGADATRARALFAANAKDFSALSLVPMVDYPGVWAAKQAVLERRFFDFDAMVVTYQPAEAAQGFARFISDGGAPLRRFAIFEAISESLPGVPWMRWPDGLADVNSAAVEKFARHHEDRIRFHQYLQYLCNLQMGAASAAGQSAGLGIGLVRDLAIGAAPDGAEVWSQPELFVKGVSVGAPPDTLAPEGQIWGLPPMSPHQMTRTGFAGFAGLLAANMRHAGGLRIDHVMGLTRLFWVPDGAKGEDGAYIDYPFRDMLGQVTLESSRARCMIVGEDLGTVPEGLREPLAEADVQSYRVLLLERNGIGFNPPENYARNALTCISTHDLPTFAGWWEGADLKERHALGMPGHADLTATLAIRDKEKTALIEALIAEGLIEGPADAERQAEDVMPAAHAFIARSPAALVVAQTDDLAAERVAVNLPGTSLERPNWQRKIETPIPGLLKTRIAQAVLTQLRQARPRDGDAAK